MQQVSKNNFGIIVAFIIPGFIGIWGLSYISPTIKSWFIFQQQPTTSIPALFYVLLSSLAVGMAVSAFRWALIDTIHHHTGIIRPALNFSNLKDVLQEFETINEHHYRYYQYYANTLIALVCTYSIRCIKLSMLPWYEPVLFLGLSITVAILFYASRDSLKQFYIRASQLLGILEKEV